MRIILIACVGIVLIALGLIGWNYLLNRPKLNTVVQYAEHGGTGSVSVSWRTQNYEKTTGEQGEITFRVPDGESRFIVSRESFASVAGMGNIGGWLWVDKKANRIDLHLYKSLGTFSIEHPCNGSWRFQLLTP